MRKLLVLITLLSGACSVDGAYNSYEPIVGQARLAGLVNGSQIDDQAEIVHMVEPGVWSEIVLTNPDNGGAYGMLFLFVDGDINDFLTPGVRTVSYSDGVSAQLCGEDDEDEWFDEEADEIVIEVDREEDGSGTVVFSANAGDQFQIGTVTLGTDGFPVSMSGPGDMDDRFEP